MLPRSAAEFDLAQDALGAHLAEAVDLGLQVLLVGELVDDLAELALGVGEALGLEEEADDLQPGFEVFLVDGLVDDLQQGVVRDGGGGDAAVPDDGTFRAAEAFDARVAWGEEGDALDDGERAVGGLHLVDASAVLVEGRDAEAGADAGNLQAALGDEVAEADLHQLLGGLVDDLDVVELGDERAAEVVVNHDDRRRLGGIADVGGKRRGRVGHAGEGHHLAVQEAAVFETDRLGECRQRQQCYDA